MLHCLNYTEFLQLCVVVVAAVVVVVDVVVVVVVVVIVVVVVESSFKFQLKQTDSLKVEMLLRFCRPRFRITFFRVPPLRVDVTGPMIH